MNFAHHIIILNILDMQSSLALSLWGNVTGMCCGRRMGALIGSNADHRRQRRGSESEEKRDSGIETEDEKDSALCNLANCSLLPSWRGGVVFLWNAENKPPPAFCVCAMNMTAHAVSSNREDLSSNPPVYQWSCSSSSEWAELFLTFDLCTVETCLHFI